MCCHQAILELAVSHGNTFEVAGIQPRTSRVWANHVEGHHAPRPKRQALNSLKLGIEGQEVLVKQFFLSQQNVLSEAKQSLVNIARDQNQYPKILEGLIAQVSHGNTALFAMVSCWGCLLLMVPVSAN